MLRIIGIILTIVATSFCLFPFYFKFLPSVNTKMAMAAVGLCVLGYNLVKKGNNSVDKGFLSLTLWSFGISIASLLAMTINGTHDNSFLTYFMSMWVWLGGAYMLISIIKWVHARVSIKLVCNYCIAVCVCQCLLALIFNNNPEFEKSVMQYITGEAYMSVDTADRLHGIGVALDVAGLKFATVVTFIAILISRLRKGQNWQFGLYILSFIIITIVGNMISRSTVVGVGLALVYWLWAFLYKSNAKIYISRSLLIILLSIPLITGLYNSDERFRGNLRFGFEGFFSLAETGEWRTGSNDILENMVVWPDNFKTWMVGDGYAANPNDKNLPTYDPYYVGPSFHGFYMQTDIGYCRYIFYFGLIGLIAFIAFFINATSILTHRFPQWKLIFIAILVVNFIGWTKVSTDLFVMLAPFLCISARDEKESNEILSKEDNNETLKNNCDTAALNIV